MDIEQIHNLENTNRNCFNGKYSTNQYTQANTNTHKQVGKYKLANVSRDTNRETQVGKQRFRTYKTEHTHRTNPTRVILIGRNTNQANTHREVQIVQVQIIKKSRKYK